MVASDTSLRLTVAVAVAASVLVFYRPALDDFTLPKITAVLVAVVFVVVLSALRALDRGALAVVRTPFRWVVLAFVLAAIVSVATTVDLSASLVGQYGRYLGLIPYLVYILLGFRALTALRDRSGVVLLLRTVLITAAITAVYTLVQWAGLDPFDWQLDSAPIFGTLGNSNFDAAVIGMAVPVALWQALEGERALTRPAWRWTAAALLPLFLAAIVGTGAAQGALVAAAAGLLVVVVLVADRVPAVDRLLATPGRILAVGGLLVGVAGGVFLAFRPLLEAAVGIGFRERLLFYETAIDVAADNPVVGTGWSTFGSVFTRYQPPEHPIEFGLYVVDSPHSVPLGMLAEGGVLLALTWLAVVLYVGWRLVQGLAARDGAERHLVAALGGVWLGYQVQSAISIDEPALVVLHWVSAGILVGVVESPEVRTVQLPAALVGRRTKKGRRRGGVPAAGQAVAAALVIVGVVAAWQVTRYLRADTLVGEAQALGRLAAEGEQRALPIALDRLQRAHDLAPWEGRYWAEEAAIHAAVGQQQQAYEAQLEAIDRTEGRPAYFANAAQLAQRLGRTDEAGDWWIAAVEVDPNNPLILVPAAEFFAEHGRQPLATQLVEHVLSIQPDNEAALELRERIDA